MRRMRMTMPSTITVTMTAISTTFANNTSPHWDSNPDCIDFKSTASAGWAMGGKHEHSVAREQLTDEIVSPAVGQNCGAHGLCAG